MQKKIKRRKKQKKTQLTNRALLHHNAHALANEIVCYIEAKSQGGYNYIYGT